MDLGIAGCTAVVAAGTSGLGLGTARALAAEGVDVSICGRDPDRLAAALEQVRAVAVDGSQPHGTTADVRDPADLARWLAEAEAAHGPPDIAIGNAGGPPPGRADEHTTADYRDALELNLLASIELTQQVLPGMRQRGFGRIVYITSQSVLDALPDLALSNVARPGLVGYAKSLVAVLADEPITVNVLAPGGHDTPRSRAQDRSRLGDPDDFGAVAAFICSRQASYVHGAIVPVDGGTHGGWA